jgi:transposase-like protein
VLDRQAHSGLSVKDFCGREHLAESSLYHWRRRISQRGQRAMATPARPAFLPVMVHQDHPAEAAGEFDGQIAIELRGGRVMRLPASMPAPRLAQIILAIEGAA